MEPLTHFTRPFRLALATALVFGGLLAPATGQTDCGSGSTLDTSQPKDMSVPDLTQKFLAGEDRAEAARQHYSYTQDVLVQTLDAKSVSGQFHQVANVSYDDKGKRLENVTFAEQSTLQGIQLEPDDMNDIRVFMPWILTSQEARQYTLTYMGKQHVDDIDTYVFHVVPKKEEKNKRYFEGRIWVDTQYQQIAKLCGKSVPDAPKPKKKNQPIEVRPTFVTYRQIIDGNWLPVYSRIDQSLQFGIESVHVREIVKFENYKRTGGLATAASKP